MSDTPSAAELIEQAEAATTSEELDDIEADANDRVTVLDAIEKRRAELATEPTATVDEPTATVTEAPPPPIEPPPVPESLAEQVQREAHEVPESTGPSDYVPNKPNIRPPAAETVEAEAEEEPSA